MDKSSETSRNEEQEQTSDSSTTIKSSRVVKASQKLKEATESDLIFTQAISGRISSKIPKSISAILNGNIDNLNSSNESVKEHKVSRASLSKQDEELLKSGDAIDLVTPISSGSTAVDNIEVVMKIEPNLELSPRQTRPKFKRVKAIKSVADTTTKEPQINESFEGQESNFNAKLDLSENIITSTSNELLLTEKKDEEVETNNDRENETIVSSSNITEDSRLALTEIKVEPTTSPPMVTVDTVRVRKEIQQELARLAINESDFLKTVLRSNDKATLEDLLGNPIDFSACSEEAKRHYVEIGMWLTKEDSRKLSFFKAKQKSARAPNYKQRMTSRKALQKYKNAQTRINVEKSEPKTKWTKDANIVSDDLDSVKLEAESYSEIEGSKRMTRARLFGSPAKAAEERKSLDINELYKEQKKSEPTKRPNKSLTMTSASALIGEKLAKSMKRKVKGDKVSSKQISSHAKNEIYDKNQNKVTGSGSEKVEINGNFEKVGSEPNISEIIAKDTVLKSQSLDCFLSTSPIFSSGDSQASCDGQETDRDISGANKNMICRTKHVSRNDALFVAPEDLRIPKLRLSAIEDKSKLVIDRSLPPDENEEFTPGNKSVPISQPEVQTVLMTNEAPLVHDDESNKKRKRSSKTPTETEKPAKCAPVEQATENKSHAESWIPVNHSYVTENITAKESVDLRLAEDEMTRWISRITIGGIGNMVDSLGISELELRFVKSDMALKSLAEPCGLCDCCAMDLQCNECAQCVNGPNEKLPKCPFKMCLLHVVIRYLRGLVNDFMIFYQVTRNIVFFFRKKSRI